MHSLRASGRAWRLPIALAIAGLILVVGIEVVRLARFARQARELADAYAENERFFRAEAVSVAAEARSDSASDDVVHVAPQTYRERYHERLRWAEASAHFQRKYDRAARRPWEPLPSEP